jgi:hypothetical protein
LHVDWFVERFKDESKDIDAGTVAQNYHQKKGEPKLDHQDYKNLMRLVVQKEFARVVDGFVTSKRYKIRMVSEEYPYIQTVFDEEFFLFMQPQDTVPNSQTCRKLFPEVSEQEWNNHSYCEAYEVIVCRAAALYDAFFVQNYRGGDLSTSALRELGSDKNSGKHADCFQLEIESFILQYKALKAASLELDIELSGSRSPVNGLYFFSGEYHGFNFEHACNYYFYKVIQANLIWGFWRHIDRPGKDYKRARSTELKKWGEILSGSKDGILLKDSDYPIDNSDYSQEFLDVRMYYQLVSNLPLIANRPEVIEAVNTWLEVLRKLRRIEYSLTLEK